MITTKVWKKLNLEDIKKRVFEALDHNVNFDSNNILGVPASYLDDKIFNQDASFLKDAPYISTLVKNPNHIGCHTLSKSEPFFKGTQELEREVIEICAVDILNGSPNQQDGYVASGGTEANIQAVWIYRNYFRKKFACTNDDIAILCSMDSHYSVDKAANLCSVNAYKVAVDLSSREISFDAINNSLEKATEEGKKYFIVFNNMMTTMYGSVDDVDLYVNALQAKKCPFKIHVDGAFGGFYYPFAEPNTKLSFGNPHISSFTLDAHKMAQAPYGTGIFLARKNLIQYTHTMEASYVEGEDYTLIGSRSGANAVAVWMILSNIGPYGWYEKNLVLQKRTEWICEQLSQLGIEYYRHPKSNIVTIKSKYLKPGIAHEFGLVPDNHSDPQWYKIVVMDHVTVDKLSMFADALKEYS